MGKEGWRMEEEWERIVKEEEEGREEEQKMRGKIEGEEGKG